MNKATNTTLEQVAKYLLEHDDFLILSHASPDGDTFGCSYALCGALQRIGKRARIACADPLSERFSYMRSAVEVQEFTEQVIITVDVADRVLLGKLEEIYGSRVDLAIDHHVSHVPFAKHTYVDDSAAANAEIIYDIILLIGAELNEHIAACLYTGISTDTGCFKYPSTTRATHEKAGRLMEYGFNAAEINYVMFDMKTKARLNLEQKVFESIEFFAEDKGAVVLLTKELMDSVDAEDVNSIAALPRQIQGVEIGIVLKERDDGWKASMRSSNVNVQEICALFGGGGHIRAAGCSLKNMTAQQAKEKIIVAVTEALKKAEK